MGSVIAPGGGRGERDAAGWSAVAAMTAVVAVSWAPLLARPLAGNHLGNVTARYGMQVRNLYESGIVGSDFGAGWAPYRSAPYAHHPPLLNVLDAIVGLLPGDAVIQLRIAPYALALATLPAAAALLRTLALSWPATLLATGALAGTGYFWVYGPIAFDLALILGLAAATTGLADAGDRRAATPVWVAALAALTALASWPGVAFAWGLTALLLLHRRGDRASVVVAAGTLVGTAITSAYVVGISGWSALVDQTETRTAGGSYGPTRYVRLVGGHVRDMLPLWYLVLLLPAVVCGVMDGRTRVLTGISASFAVAWLVVLNEGAVVHDYWGYLLLVPGLLGTGALVDRIGGAVARTRSPNVAVAVALGIGALVVSLTFVGVAWGPTADRYVHAPGDAGEVIGESTPPVGQTTAWSIGFPFGRVLSYEWRLPTREITDVDLPHLDPDDVVFVDHTELPGWWPRGSPPSPLVRHGDYSVVTVRSLTEALEDDPFEL